MINSEGVAIVTDDPVMAAVLSSVFVGVGQYVPVFESPRMMRPDADREIVVLVNSMRRAGVQSIIYSKVDQAIPDTMAGYIEVPYTIIDDTADLGEAAAMAQELANSMNNSNAAEKLYTMCAPSGADNKLAVVVVSTHEIDSVIAANYAIARNADFYMIQVPEGYTESVVTRLNKISAVPSVNLAIRKIDMAQLTKDLAAFLPNVDFTRYAKILFISDDIPFGITTPSVPTAHLPKLKLGISIANSLGEYVTALDKKHAFNGTLLANREIDTRKEEDAMAKALLRTRGLVKTERMTHAKLSELEVEVFPYDVLYIATHGSQVVAEETTYDFRTTDGANHEIVVSIGSGTTGSVHHIVSVDGIPKSSPNWAALHKTVWTEYIDRVIHNGEVLDPQKIESVLLPMRDLQFESNSHGMGSGSSFQVLAGGYLPLVVVNACGSWNDLSGHFMFAGCSAFVGTLLPVHDTTAENYAEVFFENLFADELINVAHRAKQSLPDDYARSLYSFCGTFESKFDFASSSSDPNGIEVLQRRLPQQIQKISERIKELNGKEKTNVIEYLEVQKLYLKNELEEFNGSVAATNK